MSARDEAPDLRPEEAQENPRTRGFTATFSDGPFLGVETGLGEQFRSVAHLDHGSYDRGNRRVSRAWQWVDEQGRFFRVQVDVMETGGEL